MAIVSNAVPEDALDYDEIMRRGGANCGDEDFALCKCPHCGRVYLVEYEVDTLYVDAAKLERRVALKPSVWRWKCDGCDGAFPEMTPWIGPTAPESMQVTWQDLAASPWRWITLKTRLGVGHV